MTPDIENDIFAGALGLWIGYMFTVKLPTPPTPVEVGNLDLSMPVYIVGIFLSVTLTAALLRVGFSKTQTRKRVIACLAALTTTLLTEAGIIGAFAAEPNLIAGVMWQVFLLSFIVLFWIVSAASAVLVKSLLTEPTT